jgi:hypothetical protein
MRLSAGGEDAMNGTALKGRIALAVVTAAVTLSGGLLLAQSGYINVDLFTLNNYGYLPPRPADVKAGKPFKSPIPESIKALNGKRVRIDGFMIPFDQASTRVSEFMLVASYDSCGFGDLPTSMNDWVYVEMLPGKVAHYTPNPIVVLGQFEVGEQYDEAGFVTSIYRLKGEGTN